MKRWRFKEDGKDDEGKKREEGNIKKRKGR